MRVLVDTNVLLRSIQHASPFCSPARQSLKVLRRRGYELCVTPQNVKEFWNACTRPTDYNGLGMSIQGAERHARLLERYFTVLPDSILTYSVWRQILVRYQVIGTRVHDAYLAAAMKACGVNLILTFNTGDFARFDGIEWIDPRRLA